MKPKVILMCSGGLDSTVLMYKLIHDNIQFQPVFVNYGQHCAQKELQSLQQVLPSVYLNTLEILDVSSIYKYSNSHLIKAANLWNDTLDSNNLYVPFRNLLLFTIGISFAQTINANKVYAAIINSNHAKEIDCSADFFTKLNTVIDTYQSSVELVMPFRYMSKYEVAKLGLDLKAPIGQTFSCQMSPHNPCGACPNCVERLDAIEKLWSNGNNAQ
jgi:7-cyano-7-deazaguanine synthase